MEEKRSIVIDWDGTLVANEWPNQPEVISEEAVDAVQRMFSMGYQVKVYTSRLHPVDYHTSQRVSSDKLVEEEAYIRRVLDAHGLEQVSIYTDPGKPGADMYIDDKARQYTGDARQWAEFVEELRASQEAPAEEYVI